VTPQARPSSACVNRRRFRAFLSIMPDLLEEMTLAVLIIAGEGLAAPRDRRVPCSEFSVVTVVAPLTERPQIAFRQVLDLQGMLEAVVIGGVVIQVGDGQDDFQDALAVQGLSLAATDEGMEGPVRRPRSHRVIFDPAEFTPMPRPHQDLESDFLP
jgi:hypothetical protein